MLNPNEGWIVVYEDGKVSPKITKRLALQRMITTNALYIEKEFKIPIFGNSIKRIFYKDRKWRQREDKILNVSFL